MAMYEVVFKTAEKYSKGTLICLYYTAK